MHHEKDVSQEVMSEILASKLGPTGRFPGGKLTVKDEGELCFAVGVLKGKVVVNFGTPVASIGMSPKEARELALSLIQKANAITESPQKKGRRKRRKRAM